MYAILSKLWPDDGLERLSIGLAAIDLGNMAGLLYRHCRPRENRREQKLHSIIRNFVDRFLFVGAQSSHFLNSVISHYGFTSTSNS